MPHLLPAANFPRKETLVSVWGPQNFCSFTKNSYFCCIQRTPVPGTSTSTSPGASTSPSTSPGPAPARSAAPAPDRTQAPAPVLATALAPARAQPLYQPRYQPQYWQQHQPRPRCQPLILPHSRLYFYPCSAVDLFILGKLLILKTCS